VDRTLTIRVRILWNGDVEGQAWEELPILIVDVADLKGIVDGRHDYSPIFTTSD